MNTGFRLTDEEVRRVENQLSGTQTISQFSYSATMEKVNRMEKRDERARRENLMQDVKAMRPVLEELLKQIGVI